MGPAHPAGAAEVVALRVPHRGSADGDRQDEAEHDCFCVPFANLALGWNMIFVAEDGRPDAVMINQR